MEQRPQVTLGRVTCCVFACCLLSLVSGAGMSPSDNNTQEPSGESSRQPALLDASKQDALAAAGRAAERGCCCIPFLSSHIRPGAVPSLHPAHCCCRRGTPWGAAAAGVALPGELLLPAWHSLGSCCSTLPPGDSAAPPSLLGCCWALLLKVPCQDQLLLASQQTLHLVPQLVIY
jgi:hypothetical protein